MKYVYQMFIFFIIVCQSLFSNPREQLNRLIYFPEKGELKLLSVIKQGFTRVSIIKDKQGNKYCVKQMKDRRVLERWDYRLIIELLCSYIAETIDAPINVVEIIPKDIEFTGKIIEGRVASLHTFAHGRQLNQPGPYHDLNIRKYFLQLINAAKRGLSSQKVKEGFMVSMIADMSRHHQLPIIVALDTFVGNRRGGMNLFYDQKSDQFCGIDMEKSFRKDLSQKLYQFFVGILGDLSVQLNNSELKALIVYRNTLKKLLQKNRPVFLKKLLDEIIIKSKIDLSSEVISNQIKKYKENIDKMYISANKLVKILDRVIKKQLIV